MSGRSGIFATFRRRRVSVGRVVLAWFVLAASGAGAAPCFAMASATPAAHTGPAVSHEPSTHDDSHSAQAHHSAQAEQPDPAPLPSNPCSHCPLSVAMAGEGSTSSHALCAATDHVSDGAKPNGSSAVFKTVPALPLLEFRPFDPGPSRVRDKHRPPDAAAASIALNLRHCVLLI